MDELHGLVEPKLLKLIDKDNYKISVEKIPLSYNRFDLVFKLSYLESISLDGADFYRDCYEKHIGCFTQGSFVEDGNEEKNNIDKFKKDFYSLSDDICKNGFDSSKSLIPVACDGSILNGAHRTSALIFFNKKAKVIKTNLVPNNYNYKFFMNRGMPEAMIEFGVQKFISYSENCYVALIWPAAKIENSELEAIFKRVVYKKEISLNFSGAKNLIAEAYKGAPWLDETTKNGGIHVKQSNCFNCDRKLRIFVFQSDDFNEVLNIKEAVRDICKVGKHSIHITDNHDEAIALSDILFNKNSIHALINAKNWNKNHKLIDRFKKKVIENKLNLKDYLITSGLVLDKYCLREASDLDYLTLSKEIECLNFDEHSKELEWHQVNKVELLTNPKFFFINDGIKYLSLNQLKKMKKTRGKEKDIIDLKLIDSCVETNLLKELQSRLEHRYLYSKMKIKFLCLSSIKKILIKIGCFNKVKLYYGLIFKK
ncbi:hypothetical protein [Vibrio chagasii]|uniref:hypothetical protein n=1 Tax=Vibrio chagasii TaxID=170679 RepID=UPI00406913E4